MKIKSLALLLFIVVATSCQDFKYDANLKDMEKAVKLNIRDRDIDNNTQTEIDFIKSISYEEIPEPKRQTEDEIYEYKVYLQAKYSYLNSSRIYNIDDTLIYFFDKDMKLLRRFHK